MHKRNKKTVRTKQITLNASTRITKTLKHYKTHTCPHPHYYKQIKNNHSIRYPNEIVTIDKLNVTFRVGNCDLFHLSY